jgi:hypothetical protein
VTYNKPSYSEMAASVSSSGKQENGVVVYGTLPSTRTDDHDEPKHRTGTKHAKVKTKHVFPMGATTP